MKRNRTFQKALGEVKKVLETSSLAPLPRAPDSPRYFIGVSGGADSLALAAVLRVALREEVAQQRVECVIVDHGLQPNSADVARAAQQTCQSLGFKASVKQANLAPGSNLEARAREARYALLSEDMRPGDVLLLAHTQNDQAENVLLGLVRGSGLSALHGMRTVSRVDVRNFAGSEAGAAYLLRPFLGLKRSETEAICHAQKLEWWDDPTNTVEELRGNSALTPSVNPIIPQYPLRSQVRSLLMPHFESLAPGVQQNLARTAELARIDDDFLWSLAKRELEGCRSSAEDMARTEFSESTSAHSSGRNSELLALSRSALQTLDLAVRYRVLALWLEHPPLERIREVDEQLVQNLGVGGLCVELAGGVKVVRQGDTLHKEARA